jgi:exosortase K
MKTIHDYKQFLVQNGVFYLLALLIAYGLKYHYSRATSADLAWILSPTAALVAQLSGVAFTPEAGTGYINYEHRLIIAPVCAGVNFLIIAFGAAVFAYLHTFRSPWRKLGWVGGSLSSAYLATLAVNTVRILLALKLSQIPLAFNGFTPAQLHRLEGILVYLAGLYLYLLILRKMIHNNTCTISLCSVALGWYGLMTLIVPFLNAAYLGNPSLFREHCGVVLLACGALVGVALFSRWSWRHLLHNVRKETPDDTDLTDLPWFFR